MLLTLVIRQTPYFLSFFFNFFVFQAANPNKVSDDLIESFRDDLRAGRSVNSGKTLEDFCTASNFDVRARKTEILTWFRLRLKATDRKENCLFFSIICSVPYGTDKRFSEFQVLFQFNFGLEL